MQMLILHLQTSHGFISWRMLSSKTRSTGGGRRGRGPREIGVKKDEARIDSDAHQTSHGIPDEAAQQVIEGQVQDQKWQDEQSARWWCDGHVVCHFCGEDIWEDVADKCCESTRRWEAFRSKHLNLGLKLGILDAPGFECLDSNFSSFHLSIHPCGHSRRPPP